MNVISNNCCGGWLYKNNHVEYGNPFMWSITQYNSIMYLLTHFYDINWANIKFSESPLRHNTYQIIVDGQVAIHYIHCLFNKIQKQPTKVFRANIGNDIDYCQIWEYVYEKYMSRVKRMIANGKEPVFLLSTNVSNCHRDEYQINKLLEIPTPFKRIVITTIPNIASYNDNNLVIYTNEYTSNNSVITQYLPLINDFIGFHQ